jgi:hypothetical protein
MTELEQLVADCREYQNDLLKFRHALTGWLTYLEGGANA